MRKLSAAGFAFAGGMAAAHYLLPAGALLWLAAGLLLLAGAAALALRGERRARLGIVFAFAALALGWYSGYGRIFLAPAAGLDGVTETVTVRIREYPYRDGEYASVDAVVMEEGLPRLGVSVYDYSGSLPELRPGDIARLELEFSAAEERYGEKTDIYAARGTHLRADYLGFHGVRRDAASLLYFPGELMRLMSESIRLIFPERVRDMMLALLIGETDGIYDDYELYDALSVTGVMHVVSVSGMHLAFLYSAVTQFAPRRRAALIGAPLIILFTFMAGCSSAIVRSCIMLLLGMAGPLLKREPDPLNGLALALLILLAANPMSIASASLQLSFGSMLGLTLVTPRMSRALSRRILGEKKGGRTLRRRLARAAIANVSASLGATVFTAPLVALLFGYVSLVSPIANLLTLWAVSAAFTIGFAAAAAGMTVPAAGAAAAWIAAAPAAYFVEAVKLLARLPLAAVYVSNALVAVWLAFTYAAFLTAYLMRRGGRLRPLVPALCSAAVLAAALVSTEMEAKEEHSVTVLDTGQGQSIAVLAGENAVIVDCGGQGTSENAGDAAGEFLLGRGRDGIDALVLTHLHSDHANGAARLMSRVDVGALYIPAGVDDPDGELKEILASAEESGTQVIEVGEDARVEFGGIALELTAPAEEGDENERGVAVRASIGSFDAVITGDLGSAAERAPVSSGALRGAELLVAGHHGSRYSNSFELVRAVRPETVVVSVGYNNFGHPTGEALFRLGSMGAEIYRTDENGNVTVRLD